MNRRFAYNHDRGSHRATHRRGVVMMLTVFMLTVLLGFTALTIDLGMMYNIKADLQRAADVAALAAVQDLRDADASTAELARQTALEFVALNPILHGQQALVDALEGIVTGRATLDEEERRVNFAPGAATPNAVRVSVSYDMDFAFARIFGLTHEVIHATALAAVPLPSTADVVPISLPVPDFGPVDPDIAEHNPGKTGPSEPSDGERFAPGEEVAVFIFGMGPRQPVHLVLDITDSNGVAGLNSLLAAEEALGGEREPVDVSIGDEYYVWNEGTGDGNFGVKLETRITDNDPDNDTVVMPIIETIEGSRDEDGDLEGKVRIVDFIAVTLTEIRQVEIPVPNHPNRTMTISVLYGNVVELYSGSGNGFDTTSGDYTYGSIRAAPQLVM